MTGSRLAGLHPASFAMAMATGIVSIAAFLHGLERTAWALFVVNLVVYPLLWALILARVVRHRPQVLADLAHHGRSVGFFATVAATSVLGSQCLMVGGWRSCSGSSPSCSGRWSPTAPCSCSP